MSDIFKKCGKGKYSRLGYDSYKECVKGKGKNKDITEFAGFEILSIEQIDRTGVAVHIKSQFDNAEYSGIIEED